MSQLNSALFVDFDNIFICASFERIGKEFVNQIPLWLAKLSLSRNFNIKQVYMNPKAFSQFRKAFLEHGFKVIDCPPITNQGKTATDQEIAVDATMAMMTHPHIQEYVIMSADADFTPVLRNARALGKKTSICYSGNASKCYTSVAQCVYTLSQLISLPSAATLPKPLAEPPRKSTEPTSDVIGIPATIKKQLESVLIKYLSKAINPSYIGIFANSAIVKQFNIPADRFGYSSFSKLIEQLNLTPYVCQNGYLYHPDHFCIVGKYPNSSITRIQQPNKAPQATMLCALTEKEKYNIAQWLKLHISKTNAPFHVSDSINDTSILKYAKTPFNYGFRSFTSLIKSLDLGELTYHSGYFYNPNHHQVTGNYPNCQIMQLKVVSTSNPTELQPIIPPRSLSNKIDKVLEKLDVPLLTTNVFARIFSFLAKGIGLSLYCPKALSNFVATEVVKSDRSVKERHIENIIYHLQQSGHYFSNNDSAKTLTNAFSNFLHRKCIEQKIPMTIKEQMQIRRLFIADKN